LLNYTEVKTARVDSIVSVTHVLERVFTLFRLKTTSTELLTCWNVAVRALSIEERGEGSSIFDR
jgi:hypothetical protein